jgi:hypothetical protein
MRPPEYLKIAVLGNAGACSYRVEMAPEILDETALTTTMTRCCESQPARRSPHCGIAYGHWPTTTFVRQPLCGSWG